MSLYTFHELKIVPKYYLPVKEGIKNFELRKNDRDYQVGDTLILCEATGVPVGDNTEGYTGRYVRKRIKYILKDCPEYGLIDGYCILGF